MRHTGSSRALVLSSGILIAIALLNLPVLGALSVRCGVWRWSVKTLSDDAASRVSFVPVATTITRLRELQVPEQLWRITPRLQPAEFRTYRIRSRLLEYKREDDRDFHVVVEQLNRPGATMVVEVVDPSCPGASSSPRVGTLGAVRRKFVDLYGEPTASFRSVPGRPEAFVTGIGFFDLCTPGHNPRGAAPNCIELHPVLNVEGVP